MQKTALLKVGGSMFGAVLNITSITLDLYGLSAPFGIDWRFIALVGFIIFAGCVY